MVSSVTFQPWLGLQKGQDQSFISWKELCGTSSIILIKFLQVIIESFGNCSVLSDQKYVKNIID